MLRLPKSILSHLLSPASPIFLLHCPRLLSVAAKSDPATPFAVEDYLVTSCGLTRAQAAKAFTKLAHLRSPSKPDAVVAFLAGLGLSGADIAAVVAKDPLLLCAGVERTLAPRVSELASLGLSPPEIARLVPHALPSLRSIALRRNLEFWLRFFGGSFDDLLRAVKGNYALLAYDVEGVIKPNVAFLREYGLTAAGIAKLCLHAPRFLSINLERLREVVACAQGLGVRPGSGLFRSALHTAAFSSEAKIAAKVDLLKKTFRWSDAEVRVALSNAPMLLRLHKDSLQRKSDFLISEVGLEPAYIARRTALLTCSLEGRLRPRYYVFKYLTANGLIKRDFYGAVHATEQVFVDKFIHPHEEAVPGLAQDYHAVCQGKVPTRFKSI